MMKRAQNKSGVYNILLVIFCIVFVTTPKSINAQELGYETGYDYGANSEKGPSNWGSVKPKWSACGSGTMQSPIDLGNWTKEVTSFESWPRSYKTENATIRNRGHDVEMAWFDDSGSTVVIADTEYVLRSANWHTPSEHTINGTRYDMELQLVHTKLVAEGDIRIAIVAVLFKIEDHANQYLNEFWDNLSWIVDHKNDDRYLGPVNPYTLVRLNSTENFMYTGSLTEPPCTEGVVWIVSPQIESVRLELVGLLLRAAEDEVANINARPLQPTNNREITFLHGQDLFLDPA